VLQQKVTGRHRFRVTYDLKPAAAAAVRSGEAKAGEPAKSELSVSVPQALGLKNADGTDLVALVRSEGELAVFKDRSLSVAAEPGPNLEAIDARELKTLDRNAHLAFRYEKQPVQLKLAIAKYSLQEVLETVVPRALIEVVVGRDATAVYRCRFLIKSSQRQRLAVDLPGGSSPLGVFLDGKPVALENNPVGTSEEWSSYFVNVARAKSSEESMLLAIQFRRPVSPQPFETLGGRLKLAFPRIGGATAGDRVAVQQLRTAVWVPSRFALVRTPQDFTPESATRLREGALGVAAVGPSAAELDGWIGGSRGGLFEFPSEGNGYVYNRLGAADDVVLTWFNMAAYTLVISLAVALIAWFLRRRRWESLATVVLVVTLVAVLGALIDADLVAHLLLAARFGLVAAAAIWLIEGLRRFLARRGAERGTPPPMPIVAGVESPSQGQATSESPDQPGRGEAHS
jgi:hypothetical protein